MNKQWFKDCQGDEEVDNRRKMVQNASPALNVLKKILEKQLDDLVASGERKDLYENPSWVYRQADNIGARHFAAQATMIQNFMGLVNSPLWMDPTVRSHFSGKQIAKMVEEMLGLERFALYGDNIQLFESAQTMNMQSQIQEDLMVADQTPTEAE